MIIDKKPFKEEFAKFFENPTRENFRELLKNNLGEFPYCDFKEELPSYPKLAKILLGLANSGGGCIVIGVSENSDKTLESKGVNKIEDKSNIIKGIAKFMPDILLSGIEIIVFQYEDSEYKKIVGKKFQVIFVEDIPTNLPFVSISESNEINKSYIYVRRSASTEPANYEELQRIINRRVETGYSSKTELDFETHFQQLRVLYKQIARYYTRTKGGIILSFGLVINRFFEEITGTTEYIHNPNYPKESFDDFINRMIEKKKKRIENILDS